MSSDWPRRHLKRAIALAVAGVLTLSLVAEAAAQRGGFAGARGFGGGITGIGGGRVPVGAGVTAPRGPGGGAIRVPPGGYGPAGPGREPVVVVQDDDPPPQRRRNTKAKTAKKKPSSRQIAQRGGFDAPPPGERRFVANEVLLNVNGMSTTALDALARRHRLTRLELRDFAVTQRRIARLRIDDGRAVATVIRSLQVEARLLGAQPNYLYALEQGKAADGPPQYALGKMRIAQAHTLAKGESVRVAVIDSMIDANHPDIAGAIEASFDATGAADKPHHHGTAIAGVIAAHGRLIGAAPSVRILAVNAFSAQSQNGTGMNILKGLDWAGTSNAEVINMSFAGPPDTELRAMLGGLRRKGVVLVAAAGNAGPKSRPLYPAAEPDVIAVTATDSDDRLYVNANRGAHIAVAAPGVDIVVAAAEGGYRLQSGTSFSAPQVSGIVALMLERNRKLDPDAIRRILTATARDLGVAGRDDEFGAGLVDALGAVEAAMRPQTGVSGAAAQPSN